MAKFDYYDVRVQVGQSSETHYVLELRTLFEDGDNIPQTIVQVTDQLQTEAFRIAEAGYVERIDKAL